MENASKALIIAGAILIAIILISIGVMVINNVNKPINQATKQSDAQVIELFNSQFSGYIGSGKSASSVKTLLTLRETSNGKNPKHQVNLPTTGNYVKSINDVNSLSTYKVEVEYGSVAAELGYIVKLKISPES